MNEFSKFLAKKIEEYFERIAGEHRIVRPVSDKDRGVLDEALQGEIEELRKSRFFPGSDTTALALRMFKQLKDGDFREGSAQVRSKAFGAFCPKTRSNRAIIHSNPSDPPYRLLSMLETREDRRRDRWCGDRSDCILFHRKFAFTVDPVVMWPVRHDPTNTSLLMPVI